MATFYQKKNNARSTLAVALGISDTTLTVVDATKFPNTFPFLITIWNKTQYPNPSDDANVEIIEVTSSAGSNIFNVVRGKENTSATTHSISNAVEMLITAGTFEQIEDAIDTLSVATAGHGIDVSVDNEISVDETELTSNLIPFSKSGFTSTNIEDAIEEANYKWINLSVDSSAAITTGAKNAIVNSVKTGNITEWKIDTDASSTTTVDVYKNGIKVSGTGSPTVSAGTEASATDLSGWSDVTIASGDRITINVTANNNAKFIAIQLKVV